MKKLKLADRYNIHPLKTEGVLEFIIKDKNGRVIDHRCEKNIIKIFSKEVLSHRAGHDKVWDKTANGGAGAWVTNTADTDTDYSVKYIVFGASFDGNGVPLDVNDSRYYNIDSVSGLNVPIALEPGASYDGGLINAIPIAEPNRPLKRIESHRFQATYQPAGTPLIQEDVRALNNIALFETTLEIDEYNGFGLSDSDYFTITEVALVAGKELDTVGACECDPHELFLETTADNDALLINFTGGDVITIDTSEPYTELNNIKEGDQIKITAAGSIVGTDLSAVTGDEDNLDQLNPYYLVLNKSTSGRDIQLDRTPVDRNNNPLLGTGGAFRDTFRIFSHRVLTSPLKKTKDIEVLVRWSIIFA